MNKFFKTREEAKAFQAEHGGEIYSCTPRSKTKSAYNKQMGVAFDTRHELVKMSETPWCVAWEEQRCGQMTEPMSVRSALCLPCDSEFCVFAQEGECRLPLVTGKLPVMTEKDGCLASIPKEDGWQDEAQETVAERVAYLFSCISKTLENAPKESKIWGTGGTHIHCDHSNMADGLSFFFNMLAGAQVLQTLGSTAYLSPFNVKLRRKGEAGDPKAIWSELCYIAKAAKERYTDGAEAPVWSDGDMFFFKNIFANTIAKVADMGNFPEDVANAFADLMDAIGLGPCTTGYYDPKDDEESGEVCETTGCYYIDC